MSGEPTEGAIVVERDLAAGAAEVFAAWADAEGMRSWMCPGVDMTHAEVEIDFRVGGRFRIVMRGERAYAHSGEYLEIDPPRRLVFSWISEFLPPAEASTRVTITIDPAGSDRCRLRLVHELPPSSGSYSGHPEGWRTILEKLGRRVERAQGGRK
jgi:uncharacterized protein YndB with AHSA1/START domain